MNPAVKASDIATFCDGKMIGADCIVTGYSVPENQQENTILWTKSLDTHKSITKGVLISSKEFAGHENDNVTYIYTEKSPRLIFAKVLNYFFAHLQGDDFTNYVEVFRKDKNLKIGDNCFIAKNVVIGEGTVIYPNASLFSGTIVGKNCLISSNCSISTVGLGFEYDGDEIVKFPQLGGVIIGNDVEIGPSSTIRRAALTNTIIESGCKIGSLCNIGHNTFIGAQSILTTQCVVGGSSKIGKRVFMGINAITRNKIIIGDNVNIGMGSVITKDIESNVVVYGNPAKVVRKNE